MSPISAFLLAFALAQAATPPTPEAAAETGQDLAALKKKAPRRSGNSPALPSAPPWRAVAFADPAEGGDCPPLEARFGRCVERVRFADLDPAWTGAAQGHFGRFSALAISSLAETLWEELAFRWDKDDDLPARHLRPDGYAALPLPAEAWDAGSLGGRRRVALPARDHWLDAATWQGVGAFFPTLRALPTNGTPAPPPLSVLTGRFALRMGFDGHAHAYDLMGADPASSAPFFEQMYPFEDARARRDQAVPLSEFATPNAAGAPVLAADGYAPFAERAQASFETFARALGITVAQFALEDVTPNQMRVLSALTLMRSPPGAQARVSGRTRDLVAAALGQTDDQGLAEAEVQHLAFENGFSLRTSQLPAAVVEPWLARLLAEHPPDHALIYGTWAGEVRGNLGDLLRPDAASLGAMDGAAIDAWLTSALRPGQDVAALGLELRRMAVGLLIGRLPESERNRVESWIFLDHMDEALASGLDPSGSTVLTPAELVAQGTDAWASVIRLHGRGVRPLPQALGGIDPTAVCTTADGRAAQQEASVRVIDLSVLVAAPAGLMRADEVLWEARDALPFLAVDDPGAAPPELDPVVDLPDHQTLYRVHWRLWSGWHLLWSAQASPNGLGHLGADTAALCSDLVLSPPDLVPTVVRASLLAGAMLPTAPVPRADEAAPTPQTTEHVALLQKIGRAPLEAMAAREHGLLVLAFDLDPDSPNPIQVRRSPYLRTRAAIGDGHRALAAGWSLYFPADPALPPPLLSPGLQPAADTDPDTPRPRWNPVPVTGWTLGGGLGIFPLRATWFDCAVDPSDTDVMADCPDGAGPLLSAGLGLDLSAQYTVWLGPRPRVALSGGPALRVDVGTAGAPWLAGLGEDPTVAWPVGAGPSYTLTLRPQAGLSAGIRVQPAPAGLSRAGIPWGVDGANGRSRVGRGAGGLQIDLLTGPGYNGLEWTAGAELWGARALQVGRPARASLRPYRPFLWFGPYVRGQVGFLWGQPEIARTLTLTQSATVLVGLRSWVRLAGAPPETPSVETPEIAP